MRSSDRNFTAALKLFDALAVIGGLILALQFRDVARPELYVAAGSLMAVVYHVIAEANGAFDRYDRRSMVDQIFRTLLIWCVCLLLLVATMFVFKAAADFSRAVVVAWASATPLLMVAHRLAFGWIDQRFSAAPRRIAVVGVGSRRADFIASLPSSDGGEHQSIEEYAFEGPGADSARNRSELHRLLDDIRANRFDLVCVLYSGRDVREVLDAIHGVAEKQIAVYVVPDFQTHEIFSSRPVTIGSAPAYSLFDTRLMGFNLAMKRLEDICVALIALLFALIPMMIIATAVKATSSGPIIFAQRRYGLGGEEITVFKFRTMHTCDDGANIPQAQRNDPRITPIGEFLRRWSLDELPQLFNVLNGSMSVVGPRPHAVAHNEMYRHLIPDYMLRHRVKPGITGLAQVRGLRGETETTGKMRRRVEADMEYIRSWSLGLDLRILVATIPAALGRQNAY